jgi:CheY-like chemotaxis protein/DNA-binding CsgD family transcriptional regulator
MRTVLVIEDDAVMRAHVRAALADWAVVEADDGASALMLLGDGLRPDLILLDVLMPGLDGYDTCARIRATDQTTPILPVTGAEEAIAFLQELACAPAVIKPVSLEDLRTAAYRAMSEAPPPLTPGLAVLTMFVRKAAEREAGVRQERAVSRYGLFASNPATRAGLRVFLQEAGVTPHVELASEGVLRRTALVPSLSLLIAAGADWVAAYAFAQEQGLPLVIAASTPAEGSAIALRTVAAIGIVVLDTSFGYTLKEAVDAVATRKRYLVPALLTPFPGTNLTLQEQKVIALAMAGLAAKVAAQILGITEGSLTQYVSRIGQKIGHHGMRDLGEWGKEWERAHPPC